MKSINLIQNTIEIEIEKIRPREEIRAELDFTFTFENNILVIFEVRPSFMDKTIIISRPIAKTRYYKSQEIWKIYWMRANDNWELYETSEVKTIVEFFEIVEEDEHGCFFG